MRGLSESNACLPGLLERFSGRFDPPPIFFLANKIPTPIVVCPLFNLSDFSFFLLQLPLLTD